MKRHRNSEEQAYGIESKGKIRIFSSKATKRKVKGAIKTAKK